MILQLTVSNIAQYYMYAGNDITVWKQAPRSTMLAPNCNSTVSPTAIICVLGKVDATENEQLECSKIPGSHFQQLFPKTTCKAPISS